MSALCWNGRKYFMWLYEAMTALREDPADARGCSARVRDLAEEHGEEGYRCSKSYAVEKDLAVEDAIAVKNYTAVDVETRSLRSQHTHTVYECLSSIPPKFFVKSRFADLPQSLSSDLATLRLVNTLSIKFLCFRARQVCCVDQ
jgi:hypothetical protein